MDSRPLFTDNRLRPQDGLQEVDGSDLSDFLNNPLYQIGRGDQGSADMALSLAGSQVGQTMSIEPPYSHYNTWYANYTNNPEVTECAWSCIFLSWLGGQLELPPDRFPVFDRADVGMEWFKKQRKWNVGVKNARPGDIAFFRFPGDDRATHAGIVLQKSPDDSLVVIEGNVREQGSSRGEVAVHVRRSFILGVGHPAYNVAKSPTTTTETTRSESITNTQVGIASVAEQMPVLRPGDRGNGVRVMQGCLLAANHRVNISGVYDELTAEHVQVFKENRGIPGEYVVEDQTWRHLLML